MKTVTTRIPKDEEALAELQEELSADRSEDLVDEGMNRHPKVYTQVQKKLRELGE